MSRLAYPVGDDVGPLRQTRIPQMMVEKPVAQ
jgi:hypothetical protein